MIAEAELDLTQQAFNQQPQRRDVYVRFEFRPAKDDEASVREGRPIFRDVEYVIIQPIGDRGTIIDRPAKDKDKRQFAKEYLHFRNSTTSKLDGTPLSEWPSVSRSQVEEMRFFGVHTVEQLAELPDVHGQKFLGIQTLKAKARAYIEAAAGNAPIEKLHAELATRDNKIESLQDQINQLTKKLNELED